MDSTAMRAWLEIPLNEVLGIDALGLDPKEQSQAMQAMLSEVLMGFFEEKMESGEIPDAVLPALLERLSNQIDVGDDLPLAISELVGPKVASQFTDLMINYKKQAFEMRISALLEEGKTEADVGLARSLAEAGQVPEAIAELNSIAL